MEHYILADIILLHQIEINPIHINTSSNLTIVGLPDGLTYTNDSHLITGTPRSFGRHAIIVVDTKLYSWIITVISINDGHTTTNMYPTINRCIIGQPVDPIPLPLIQTATNNTHISNLPKCLYYDVYHRCISGTPLELGTFTVSITSSCKYGCSVIEKMLINVKCSDKSRCMYNILTKSVELSFDIYNTTDHIINHVFIKDSLLGTVSVCDTLETKALKNIKFTYPISEEDVKRGCIILSTKIVFDKGILCELPVTINLESTHSQCLQIKWLGCHTNEIECFICNNYDTEMIDVHVSIYSSGCVLNTYQYIKSKDLVLLSIPREFNDKIIQISGQVNGKLVGILITPTQLSQSNTKIKISIRHGNLCGKVNDNSLTGYVYVYDKCAKIGKSKLVNGKLSMPISMDTPNNTTHYYYVVKNAIYSHVITYLKNT